MQGFMEVIHSSNGKDLDLILHTPGGSAEATAAIVSYIRSKFNNIRVIIPHAAMSAGTMLACASDQIIKGKHSFIGPIDPQMQLQTPLGFRSVPAQAILDQFKMARLSAKILKSWVLGFLFSINMVLRF
jgi:ClpP class serine protease